MIYHITGTVEYYFDIYVEASSVETAEELVDVRLNKGQIGNSDLLDYSLEEFEEVPIMEV